MTLLRETISVAEMKEDPELAKKMLGMKKVELLLFFEQVVNETNTTLGMNDHKKCHANTRAKAKLAQVRKYMLLRMTH